MARRSSTTITLRGNAANAFMASASAFHCADEAEAQRLVTSAGDGPYGTALRAALKERGFLKNGEAVKENA